jgi:hypothetical protein
MVVEMRVAADALRLSLDVTLDVTPWILVL